MKTTKPLSFDFIVSIILGLHGLYYFGTGLWAIINLEHFNRVVGHLHPGGGFEMHSIAAMAIVLGIAYLYAARNIQKNLPIVALAFGMAIAVILPELYYLPTMEGFNLFWLDLAEEIAVMLLFGTYLFIALRENNRKRKN